MSKRVAVSSATNEVKKAKTEPVSEAASADSSVKPKITLEFFRNANFKVEEPMNARRFRILKSSSSPGSGPVIFWMTRDQRVQDNWALLHAQQQARLHQRPLLVVFVSVPTFMNAPIRHFDFMFVGLKEIETDLKALSIPFFVLSGQAAPTVTAFAQQVDCSLLITDFNPLRIARQWRNDIVASLAPSIPFIEVDAHNVVPSWLASDKQEYSAATFRRKIHTHFAEFLTEFPYVTKHEYAFDFDSIEKHRISATHVVFGGNAVIDWSTIQSKLQCDMTIPPVAHIQPGTRAGLATLALFVTTKLGIYHDKRNQPQIDACSNMSPYFHFGQVAPQRAALCALNYKSQRKESVDGFFEESVVRRELADNFCLYQPKYDSIEGFSQWARDSLELHASDPREYIYTEQQFEEGRTHDELWNAAQLEMVHAGKMHGFMRMYWAKKILEWTATPASALAIALKLNDKYELDGRDPNGFVGCAWAIGGIHDMGWAERTVFGKVRFMNYNGCKRKFDIGAYVARVRALVKVATGK